MFKDSSLHIAARDSIAWWKAWLIRLIAVLLSLIVCAIVIFGLTKMNPVEVYKGIFSGAVGTSRRAWVTIRDRYRPDTGFQDEILEYRCRRPDSCGRCSYGCINDLCRRFTADTGSDDPDVCGQHGSRCYLGRYSGDFQGLFQYK